MGLNLNRLKAERIAKGLTQEEMAKKMGWNTRLPYVKRELGYVDIGLEEFIKMLGILGYSTNDINIFFDDCVRKSEQKPKGYENESISGDSEDLIY